jgi:glycosyltransferase involved in cell wall biosynthesis
MIKKPFFSIAIPTYNRAQYLHVAIESLLLQTYKNFEIIISDNFSIDNTKEIVKSFKDPRIKYYRNNSNIGVLLNVRKAIDLSHGKYILLHGDDDFFIDQKALEYAKKIIQKTNVGFVRLNYLSLSPDKKYIFDFRASKAYTKDVHLVQKEKPIKVINFLISSDCSFITGIIFKNKIPKNTSIIDSQLYPWFKIIYYIAEHFGAYYINKPYIISNWSDWSVRDDNFHPLYSLIKGRLTSEEYLNFVKELLPLSTYSKFLHKQFMETYVLYRLPAVKYFVGNKNMLRLLIRLYELDPDLKKSYIFWLYLISTLLIPRICLRLIRNLYLYIYITYSKLDSNDVIYNNLKDLN